MPLSCSCGEWDGEGVGWNFPDDFVQFMGTKTHKRKRCCSCKAMIQLGSPCLEFERFRPPLSDIEEKIYGEESVPLASWFMCEPCGEIFLNLDALKYCVDLNESMPELLSEYHELTGWNNERNNHVSL